MQSHFRGIKLLTALWLFGSIGPELCRAQTIGNSVLPQFVFGGGWYTALYFTNLTGAPASFTVNFISDQGTALTVPAPGGSSRQVDLAAYGTAVIEAPISGSSNQGYASFNLPAGVGGYGVFRLSQSGVPDQEAVVPFSGSTSTSGTLIWDETGPSSAVAILNPSTTDANIAITVRGLDGSTIGTSSLSLPALNHTAVFLKTLSGLGGMAGHQGSAQFAASTGGVAVMGLRANGKAITSMPMTGTGSGTSVYSFKTGRYVSPSNILGGKGAIDVSGPGVLSDGSTVWSLGAAPKADSCTWPNTASWYVGPIANSPFAARLSAVKLTSTVWAYGVGDSGCEWYGNSLLGFSQVGNTITIANFTNGSTDQNTPVDQITYTLETPTSASPTSVTAFKAGTYMSPSNILRGKALINIAGPGATSGGITAWSLSAAPGADSCTFPNSANFYAGSIADSPLASRIQKAGITSTALSYGVGDAGCNWYNHSLLGFSQTGNTITIMNFSAGNNDKNTPVDQITYTLAPAQ